MNYIEEQSFIEQILAELKRAKSLHPQWPEHIVARAAIVAEEAGELVRASLNYKYESKLRMHKEAWRAEMKKEAIQTAATCLRFLEVLKDLK